MADPEAKRLELAIKPLERVLQVEGIMDLGTVPITLGVIENVVLAARNLIALHSPEGRYDADRGGELLAYVADIAIREEAQG